MPRSYDSTYFGEHYDARHEQPGWDTVGFNATWPTWTPVVHTNGGYPTDPHMSSQLMPPIRAVREIPAAAVFVVDADGDTRYTFDFGVEVAGWVRLTLPPHAPAGQNITLLHAEVLSHPPIAPAYDGSAFMGNLFWANPIDIFLAAGGNATGEVYTPRFTQHGFRYVELRANPPLPVGSVLNSTLVAVQLQTDVRPAGSLRFGHPMLQGIADMSRATESAALMGIPAGATGRGERAAWTGDAAFASESECFDFDTGAFFTSFLAQIRDASCADGTIGNAVPQTDPRRDGQLPSGPNCAGMTADLSWSSVYPTVLYHVWKWVPVPFSWSSPATFASRMRVACLERSAASTVCSLVSEVSL